MQDRPAPVSAAEIPAAWRGILDPGEKIIWQGQPDQRFHMEGKDLPGIVFPLFFSGFAVFWMTKAAESGGAFWMFGLIHFSVGIGMAWKSLFGATFRRRQSWYTLTDRRAIIATNRLFKGKHLKSYPITADSWLNYIDGPPPSIQFAREQRTTDKGRRYNVPVGFERIDEGRKVIALMREIHNREDKS